MLKQFFPLGATIRMADLSANPYDLFAALHRDEPVTWVDDVKMWYITRRADVLTVLGDSETFTVEHPGSLLKEILGTNMLTTDGAAQQRLRKPFIPAFAPRRNRERSTVSGTRFANELIDAVLAKGSADLKAMFADPLALLMVADALGLPVADWEEFRSWITSFAAGLGNFSGASVIAERAHNAKRAFGQHVQSFFAGTGTFPPDSELARVGRDGELTIEELVDSARVISFGGVETTAALIANTLWALSQHPDQLAEVRADLSLLPKAIEETLRWESPVQTATRHITRDVSLGGVRLPAGDTLQCMLGAANRDASYFPEPGRFDIHRPNSADHLAFGIGKHFCIGSGLARVEAQVGLQILLERLPRLRPSASVGLQGHEFRTVPNLPLRWD